MAVGPTGVPLAEAVEGPELGGEDLAFARGLEGVIDRALLRHPRGERFVYGVHQDMPPALGEFLRQRYLAAGWSTVSIKEGATGAYLFVLTP